MEQATFERFRSIIYRESGIVLPPEKLPLLANRIFKRLSQLGLSDEAEYLRMIELDFSGEELVVLIDAISTNVTHFYREANHFEILREILSNLRDGRREVRLWCAAASSGEEPYTMAFEALEVLNKGEDPKIKILATDICTKVLKRALEAVYPATSAERVPLWVRHKYMDELSIGGEEFWRVKPSVSSLILFKKLNLVSFPFPLKGPLDVIFCRNVMIYFDRETRSRVVREFDRLLASGGYLFLSHSENLLGVEHDFENIAPSVYRKR
jgi:chemotaxis protein methyltransferase CheR